MILLFLHVFSTPPQQPGVNIDTDVLEKLHIKGKVKMTEYAVCLYKFNATVNCPTESCYTLAEHKTWCFILYLTLQFTHMFSYYFSFSLPSSPPLPLPPFPPSLPPSLPSPSLFFRFTHLQLRILKIAATLGREISGLYQICTSL